MNRGRYSNPAFDAMLERAGQELDDRFGGGTLLQQATRIVIEDAGIIPTQPAEERLGHAPGLRPYAPWRTNAPVPRMCARPHGERLTIPAADAI